MNTEPVSYDSLKTVLQYMEANLRFQLSTHIPSIRCAEKTVPLKINNLTFNGMKVVVNETEYKLGEIKKHHDDVKHIHNNIQLNNARDGAQHNFDKYEVFDWSSDHKIMTPGDVDIGSAFRGKFTIVRGADENEMQRLEEHVERLEEIVAQVRPQGDVFLEETHVISGNGAERINMIFPRGTPIAEAESYIKNSRAELILYNCWRDNTKLPFDMYIKFTITSSNGKQIKWMRYNKKFHEAQKHLNNFLFGKRRFPIQVTYLKIVESRDGKILRLPLGLKFKIQDLKIRSKVAEIYEALKPILEPSSFPSDYLHIEFYEREDEDENERFEHAIIQSAKILVIETNSITQRYTTFQNILNQKVHLQVYHLENEDCISLIQNWLKIGRELNSYFSFEIKNTEEEITELLETIKERFNGAVPGERSVTLCMNDTLDLKIYYKADSNLNFNNDKPQWILNLKVVQHEAE